MVSDITPASFSQLSFLPSFTGSAGSELYLLLVLRALQMQGDRWDRPVGFDFLQATMEADVFSHTSRWSPMHMSILLRGSKPALGHLEAQRLVTYDNWTLRLTHECIWRLKVFHSKRGSYQHPSPEGNVLVKRSLWLRGAEARKQPRAAYVHQGKARILGMALRMRDTVLGEELPEDSAEIEAQLLRELEGCTDLPQLENSKLMDIQPFLRSALPIGGMATLRLVPVYQVLNYVDTAAEYDDEQSELNREQVLRHLFRHYLGLGLTFL